MGKDKSGCGTGSADWEPKDDNSPETENLKNLIS